MPPLFGSVQSVLVLLGIVKYRLVNLLNSHHRHPSLFGKILYGFRRKLVRNWSANALLKVAMKRLYLILQDLSVSVTRFPSLRDFDAV